MRGMKLDAVEAGMFHVARRLAETLGDIAQFRLAHNERNFAVHDGGDFRDAPQRMPLIHDHGALVVDTAAEELGELPRTLGVHRIGEFFILRDDALFPRRATVMERTFREPVAGLLFGDHQADAAARAFAVIIDMAIA